MRTYHAIDVAKRFLELAQRENMMLSNMKLQKLVFFSQVVALKTTSVPIHSNVSQAWDYGPVVLELYLTVKRTNQNPISLNMPEVAEAFSNAQPVDDQESCGIIASVWNKFKDWTAFQLSELTHRSGSPWAAVYSQSRYAEIPLPLIEKLGFGNAL